MQTDAKLGLVAGLGLVIAVAVIFFRKETEVVDPRAEVTSAVAGNSAAPAPTSATRGQFRPTKAKVATQMPANE